GDMGSILTSVRGTAPSWLLRPQCRRGRSGPPRLRAGAAAARGVVAGAHRGDRSLRRRARPGVPRARGADGADGSDVRRAGACVRLSDLWNSPDVELRLRAGERGERGLDPSGRAVVGLAPVAAQV